MEKNRIHCAGAEKGAPSSDEDDRSVIGQDVSELFHRALDAIFITQDDVIKMPNQSAEVLSGYTREELSKKPFAELVHPDDREMVLGRYRRRIEGEDVVNRYELRVVNKRGATLWVEVHVTKVEWSGRPAGLNIIRDITERKRSEEQKNEMIARLQASVHDIHATEPFLPICCHCKKIRDERGEWQAMEAYFKEHFEVEVTHTLCEACVPLFVRQRPSPQD